MRLRPLLSTSFLTAEYDEKHTCLFIHLQSFTDMPASFPSLADLLSAGTPARCLVQTSFSIPLSASYLHWLTHTLLPQLFQAGITQWLWVHWPDAPFCQLLEQVQHQLPYLAPITFYDVEHAVTWFRQPPVYGSACLLPRRPYTKPQLALSRSGCQNPLTQAA